MRNSEKLFKYLGDINESYLSDVDKRNDKKYPFNKVASLIAGGLVLASLIGVNVSPSFAKTMQNLPIVGKVFEVVTVFTVEEEHHGNNLSVKMPQITGLDQNEDVKTINRSIEEYVQMSIDKYHEEYKDDLGSINMDYSVIEDSDCWFTIKLMTTEIQAGARNMVQYYNFDKRAEKYVSFYELVNYSDEKLQVINEYLVELMQKKMQEDEDETYFIASVDNTGFESVDQNQNYYFNENRDIVLVFDEYSIAPGVMGIVELVVPKALLD